MRKRQTGRGLRPFRSESLRGACAALLVFGVLSWCAEGMVMRAAEFVASPLPALRSAFTGKIEGYLPPTGQATEETAEEGEKTDKENPPLLWDGAEGQTTFVERTLLSAEERPQNAGSVLEKTYSQGKGANYISCGRGSIKNNTREDIEALRAEAAKPLPFSIEPNSDQPQVLIMHTHATENYRMTEGLWFPSDDTARSLDRSQNMCAVGAVMAQVLNQAGVNTLHDETLNDYPSYTGSYANSHAVVKRYLEQYPSIKVVLDVHRDAIETEGGQRIAPVSMVNGQKTAQVMIICGCDNGSSISLPRWRENLRFAAQWEAAMEDNFSGLTRPAMLSYKYYNQDLTTGSLLIEIGGHGNNLNEALYAGELAARGLALLLLSKN